MGYILNPAAMEAVGPGLIGTDHFRQRKHQDRDESVCTWDCIRPSWKRFCGGSWEVDCSKGKGDVAFAWRWNGFSRMQKTIGKHCVFLRQSMIRKLSTQSKLEPAFFISDKMASEIRLLGHFCPREFALGLMKLGHLPGHVLVSAYLRVVGQ